MIKYGVTSYSFDQYLATGAMDLYGAIRKAAEMGFDGIELANITENYPYELEKLKQTAQEAGIEICAWATSADFLKDIPEQVRYIKEEIDRAAYLGCKVLRTDVFHDEYVPDPYAENIVKALRELASYAQEKGMVLTTENHCGYTCLPDRLEKLVQAVHHENFGLLCDFGNFLGEDVDPAQAVGQLRSYIRHVHVKDAHMKDGRDLYPGENWFVTREGNYWRCAIAGHGNAPIVKCLKVLINHGYDGYLIQEFEGLEECVTAVERGFKYTKAVVENELLFTWHE